MKNDVKQSYQECQNHLQNSIVVIASKVLNQVILSYEPRAEVKLNSEQLSKLKTKFVVTITVTVVTK